MFENMFLSLSLSLEIQDDKSPTMDWKTRYKIAVGTAKGLHYLHKNCPRRIIHRDIKSSNVLVAADFEPKVIINQTNNLNSIVKCLFCFIHLKVNMFLFCFSCCRYPTLA